MLITRQGVDAANATLGTATRPATRSDIHKTGDKAGVHVMPAIRELLLRVDGEYREMPGLSLTLPQAARLWGLDLNTCGAVLTLLTERGVLRQAWNGTYVRRDA